jgi:hypothetical protein
MKEYQYKGSANVSTDKNNTMVIGQKYDYKESSIIGECEFLADESTDEYWVWRLKWTIHPFADSENNTEFTCSELKNSNMYYSGMWHLYPQFTYMFPKRPHSWTDWQPA